MAAFFYKFKKIMRNLKQFNTTADYEVAESGLILPNVSLITENSVVKYTQGSPEPPTPSHDYVEIAGTKWATMNIGASSVTDYGLYFQWGDTQGYTASQVGSGEGQKYFAWTDYKYTNDDGSTMSKYNSADGLTTLENLDDAVTSAWGNWWRTPTKDEFVALGAAVNTAWTADYQGSGVSGLVLTDKADSSKVLFFPAAGICYNGSNVSVGGIGYYRSSILYSGNVKQSYVLRFVSAGEVWDSRVERYYGFNVRGVMNE